MRYPGSEALGYEALEAIARQALPPDEPFLLLGESFSGPIALSIAATRPPGLIGLILCCTFATNPRPALSRFRLIAKALPPRLAPVALLDHLLLGGHSSKDLRSALALAIAQVSSAAFNTRIDAVHSVDVLHKLASISAPVLYLQASGDRVVPSAAAALIKQALPAARVVSIDAPHCLLQAAPREAASFIRSFANEGRKR